jgi:hypothetical protein
MENFYDNIKYIKNKYGWVLHVKDGGKWRPIDQIIVKEIYDPEKEPKKLKRKWWQWFFYPLKAW